MSWWPVSVHVFLVLHLNSCQFLDNVGTVIVAHEAEDFLPEASNPITLFSSGLETVVGNAKRNVLEC